MVGKTNHDTLPVAEPLDVVLIDFVGLLKTYAIWVKECTKFLPGHDEWNHPERGKVRRLY